MNVLISVDIEGISGVVSADAVTNTHHDYDRFRRLMTAEANAAIEGALRGGAQSVIVSDAHGSMTNILIEELNPAAELATGNPKPLSMMQGIGPEIAAVFLVGYHAAAGTQAAVLDHTYSGGTVFQVSLNGRPVGEMGLNGALAGSYGAPVKLVTGDRATTEEARLLFGAIETVAVKDGVARTAARCLHPRIAQERIRQAAQRALALSVPPLVVAPPLSIKVIFQRSAHADMATLIPHSRRPDARTVEWTGDDMPTVYRTFRAMVALAMTV